MNNKALVFLSVPLGTLFFTVISACVTLFLSNAQALTMNAGFIVVWLAVLIVVVCTIVVKTDWLFEEPSQNESWFSLREGLLHNILLAATFGGSLVQGNTVVTVWCLFYALIVIVVWILVLMDFNGKKKSAAIQKSPTTT